MPEVVPAGWEVKAIRQLGRLVKGFGGSKEDVVEEGVPCVRYGDLYTTHGAAIRTARTCLTRERQSAYAPIRFGDVLFAASGETLEEIGKSAVNLIEGEARCGGDLIILRPTSPVNPRFLGYAADAAPAAAQKTRMGRGTTVKHIYPDDLRNLVLLIPSLDSQGRIADFLDRRTAAIDDLIAKKERLVALLAEKRQALITQLVSRGLDPSAQTKDSGIEWLGAIPAAWTVKRLRHISPSQTVGVVVNPSSYYSEEGQPFIFGGNVREGVIDLTGVRRVAPEHDQALVKSRLRAGDLVVVRVGYPGVAAVVPPELDGANCASVMIVRRGAFDSRWLCYALNSRVGRYQVELVQYGAAQEQFNIRHAIEWRFPVPPFEAQVALADAMDSHAETVRLVTAATSTSIDRLREYRRALIAAAVTGQLDVSDERAVAATEGQLSALA